MADKKIDEEVQPKKSDVLYSEDAAEIVDIYVQIDEMFHTKAKPKLMPTADDIEGMAATVFIQRAKSKPWTPSEKPPANETKPSGGKGKGKTPTCSSCGNDAVPKTSKKSGKDYWACDACKGLVNNDGTFIPYSK